VTQRQGVGSLDTSPVVMGSRGMPPGGWVVGFACRSYVQVPSASNRGYEAPDFRNEIGRLVLAPQGWWLLVRRRCHLVVASMWARPAASSTGVRGSG